MKFKDFNEEVNYWTGRFCVGIGEGNIRTVVSVMLMDARQGGFDAGLKKGLNHRKKRQNKPPRRR